MSWGLPWIGLVLGVWTLGLWLLRHVRRGTSDYARHQKFKSALPQWVKWLEFYSFALALAGYVILGTAGVFRLQAALNPGRQASDLSMVMIVLAIIIPAIVLAMLTTNLASWLIPAARKANIQAMSEAGDISLASLNRGLLAFAMIVVPICLIQGAVGIFEPWAR